MNSKITLNGKAATIVGIMPAGFSYPENSEAWTAFDLNDPDERRDNRMVEVVTRLKLVSRYRSANGDGTVSQRLAQNYGETNTGWSVNLVELRESLVGDLRTSLLILLGPLRSFF